MKLLIIISLIIGGLIIANLEESVKIDTMKRIGSGKLYAVDKDLQLVINQAEKRITINDGNNNRLLIGKDSSGAIKIKLSQIGQDVLSAADKDMIFSSDFNMFKILESGTVTVTKAASATSKFETVSFAEDYGNPPAFLVYVQRAAGESFTTPLLFVNSTSGIVDEIAYPLSFSNHMDFFVETPSEGALFSSERIWTFKYYILREKAN